MKKIISIKYSAAAFNFSMFFLRLVFGLLIIIRHGYTKLRDFSTIQEHFYNFLGLGMKTSLALSIFAEVLCALFLILGLFTRLATIPLIITMLVAILAQWQPNRFWKLSWQSYTWLLMLRYCFAGPVK